MGKSEYIAGFYGILIGFTLTELIKGIAETLKNRDRIKYYYPHGLFVTLIFNITILSFFDFYYFLSVVKDWTPLLLIQNTFPAIFLCFCTYVLFPQLIEKSIDFRAHYFKATPIIFRLAVVMIILILIRNIFLQHIHPFYIANVFLILLLLIVTLSIFLKKDWIQYLSLTLANLISIYWTLMFQI